MKKILFCPFILLSLLANAQGKGCFELQTKEIFHNWDREIENYPIKYKSQEACQAALSKIKVGKDGSKEVIVLKSCTPCQKAGEQQNTGGDGYIGQNGSGNGLPASNNGAINQPKPSTNAPSTANTPQKGTKFNEPKQSVPTNNHAEPNKLPVTPTPQSPTAPEEQMAQTLIEAAPGIQGAIGQYKSEKQLREALPPNYDTKPQGFRSADASNAGEWVTATSGSNPESQLETAGSWQQDLQNLWGDVKDLFGVAATSSEIMGNESWQTSFETISNVTGYLETTGRMQKAIKNPSDYENRAELAQDAFKHTADLAGTAGVGFSKFGPPVDLQKRTFEGALNRMDALLATGDPGDELQVTAPVTDWFGSMMGLGNLGTRERNYRLEGYKSFSELKGRYGYVEATKQKLYNWIHESK